MYPPEVTDVCMTVFIDLIDVAQQQLYAMLGRRNRDPTVVRSCLVQRWLFFSLPFLSRVIVVVFLWQ